MGGVSGRGRGAGFVIGTHGKTHSESICSYYVPHMSEERKCAPLTYFHLAKDLGEYSGHKNRAHCKRAEPRDQEAPNGQPQA